MLADKEINIDNEMNVPFYFHNELKSNIKNNLIQRTVTGLSGWCEQCVDRDIL